MRTFVRRWGNSAAVRLSELTLAAAGIAMNDPVEVHAEDGRIIVEKVGAHPITLEWLIASITPQNRHEETDWGPPRGREYR